MKSAPLSILLASTLLLSACQTMNDVTSSITNMFSSDEEQVAEAAPAPAETIVAATKTANCPSVQIMTDLQAMHQYTNFKDALPENKISDIQISDVQTNCTESDNTQNIALKIDITFDGEKGPKAQASAPGNVSNFDYPYFVAVTDTKGQILAKEIFSAELTYSADQKKVKQIETINQLLPKANAAQNYTVLLGFQLNEDQLMYNRTQTMPAAGEKATDDTQG